MREAQILRLMIRLETARLVGENMMQETIQRMGGKNISIGGKVIKPSGYLQKQGEGFGRESIYN